MAASIRAHFMGEFASDALCLAFLVANTWTTGGTAWQGMFYHNTVTGGYRIWTGTVWDDLGAGFGGLIDGIVYVTKNGNDITGDGSSSNPYLTVDEGITQTGVDGSVLVGPGVYAETLAIVAGVNILEMVKGTVSISNTVVGGATITITPAAAGLAVRIGCSVFNLSAATPADMAIHVNNVAGVGAALVHIGGGDTISGGALGQFLRVTGDNAAQTALTQVFLDDITHLIGAVASVLEAPADVLRYNNCLYEGGNTAWMDISGPDGDVIISNSLQAAAAAAETIDYGLGTAVGCNLHIGSSVLAGELEMNSLAGAGIVQLSAEAHIGRITALLDDQYYRILLGGDDMELVVLQMDLESAVARTLYTVPAGYVFQAYAVRTINRDVDTAAALNYRVNGTGNGTIVGAIGVAALADGCTVETVLAENAAATDTIQFDVTAQASAVPDADFADCHIRGYLKAI